MGLVHSPRIVTSGLVGYWDAANTKSYPGSGTTWNDLSSSKLTGTFNGTITYSSGSLTFDGTSGYVTANDLGNLSTWSCEAWAYKTASTAGLPTFICNAYPGINNKVNFALGHVSTNSTWGCGFYDGTWHYSPTITPSLNTWYHVAGTYNGAVLSLYINGVSQGTPTSYVGTPTSSTAGIRIGRRWDNPEYFTGKIAAVKIYNRALTEVEIQQNFNALRGRFGL
jgi:hypothetical protein